MNSFTSSYKVTGDISVYVSAYATLSPTSVTASCSVYTSGNYTYEDITVRNNTGTSIVVKTIASSNLNDGSYSQTISNGSSYTFSKKTRLEFTRVSGTISYTCNGGTYSKSF